MPDPQIPESKPVIPVPQGPGATPVTEEILPLLPQQINDLQTLQGEARRNTAEMMQLRASINGATNPQGVAEVEKKIKLLQQRSGALIRRRNDLNRAEGEKKAKAYLLAQEEKEKILRNPALEARRRELVAQCRALAEETEQSQRKASSSSYRNDARRLYALSRAAYAAYEVLRRSPSLTAEYDDEEDD